MSSRKDPWKQIGRPKYEGIHRMPFDLEGRAVEHELNRQKAVSRLLIDLYCMSAKGILNASTPIGLAGAKSQSLSGSKTRETEAAHCIPRQLIAGTRKVQDLLDLGFPERALAIDAMFGEADILPTNFNKADSRAERNGLAEALRFAAQHIANAGKTGRLEFMELSMSVNNSYALYRDKAAKAFRISQRELDKKVAELRSSRVQHSIRNKEQDKWEQQRLITKVYSNTLKDSVGALAVLEHGIVTGIIRIYNMIDEP